MGGMVNIQMEGLIPKDEPTSFKSFCLDPENENQ